MVGCAIARSTRSGTLVGPGIWRKCRPLMGSTPYQMQPKSNATTKPRNHETTKKKDDSTRSGLRSRPLFRHRKPVDVQTHHPRLFARPPVCDACAAASRRRVESQFFCFCAFAFVLSCFRGFVIPPEATIAA